MPTGEKKSDRTRGQVASGSPPRDAREKIFLSPAKKKEKKNENKNRKREGGKEVSAGFHEGKVEKRSV